MVSNGSTATKLVYEAANSAQSATGAASLLMDSQKPTISVTPA